MTLKPLEIGAVCKITKLLFCGVSIKSDVATDENVDNGWEKLALRMTLGSEIAA